MNTDGYIYLMRDQRTGLVKIGFSKDPVARLRQLTHESTLLPEPLNFTLSEAFRGTQKEEQKLHKVFAHRRIRGEWFDLCFWRLMEICYAFDARPRHPVIQWSEGEPDYAGDPFECFQYAYKCPCEECGH